MSDINNPEIQPENKGYTPASPVKRTMAWIGVVYMVILVALMTSMYFTGKTLTGIAPLLAVPGLFGLAAVAIVSYRTTGRPGKVATCILAVVSCLLALWFLPVGIAHLMANFAEVAP